MDKDLKQMEIEIRKDQNLDDIGKQLELIINQNRAPGERGLYLYLYALVLTKKQLPDQAILALEEAIKVESSMGKALLLLAKLYQVKKNATKAIDCLDRCIKCGYKKNYCCKLQTKFAYVEKDYPAVINYLADYQQFLNPQSLVAVIRVACLTYMKLYQEALTEQRDCRAKYHFSQSLHHGLAKVGMSIPESITEYAECYQKNQQYFKALGLDFLEYAKVQYKVSRFLAAELIYDCQSRRFISVIGDVTPRKFDIAPDDVLIIYNTDDIQIFKYLQETFDEVHSNVYKRRVSTIPVFVVDSYRENWQLMMQLFDFSVFSDWGNIHYIIEPGAMKLQELFLEGDAPFPNLFYGNGLDDLRTNLQGMKVKKDSLFQNQFLDLKKYYDDKIIGTFQKILVVSSKLNDSLDYYGQMLASYLNDQGYNCRLDCENDRFLKFTYYTDLKLLQEFRPDLIIHLFSYRSEHEIYNQLNIPFISWLIFNKQLPSNCNHDVLFTGSEPILGKSSNEETDHTRVNYIPLPVSMPLTLISGTNNHTEIGSNDLGIIADLENIDVILKNIINTVLYRATTRQKVTFETLNIIFKGIYFEVYSQHMSKSLMAIELAEYQEIINTHFSRSNLRFDETSLIFIADIFKQELEKPLFKLAQVSWLITNFEGYGLEIYGEGWENDPNLKTFHEGKVDFLNDLSKYQQIVQRNKINLYIGNRINNDSYMQPDLLNGIALGGFFLVNGLLVKKQADSILKPLGGLLETYNNQAEMLSKLKYFLEHESEKLEKARRLQEYVVNNFSIEKVAGTILRGTKQGLQENLH